ncbi:MAG: gliding motility-associated C-terminal domain-containing protein [Omnitrophica WOR_2 bacterium]
MKGNYFYRFQLYLIFSFIPVIAFAQGKEANNWYFYSRAAITFNNGTLPQPVSNCQISNGTGSASISDKNDGSLLFYSNGENVWNKNNTIMPNGDNVGTIAEGIMIVPDPGDENLFYLFNFRYNEAYQSQNELRYTKIDMRLDNGLGDVIQGEKNILLRTHCSGHLTAVRHNIGESIWLIAHDDESNQYLSYLITSDSLSTVPIISFAGNTFDKGFGNIKVSPNGKKLAAALYMSLDATFLEILDFDNMTGLVSDNNIVHKDWPTYGIEFSPDNSKLYSSEGILHFIQYDLSSNIPDLILSSAYQLNSGVYQPGHIQLGPDGKIYTMGSDNMYLTVINNPNILGSACNYIDNAIYMDGSYIGPGLPSFIQSYLNDPEFTTYKHCIGEPTQFTITNIHGIDSVKWKFWDIENAPNDTSTLFNPSYTFSAPGTYYPELTVWSGFLSRTVKDTVVIYALPAPDLGNDTLFCTNEPINLPLYAGPGTSYSWNGSFPPTTNPTFLVTDVGSYFVKVFDHGCSGSDTINVGRYIEPQIQNTSLPTSSHCGASDGAISGITILTSYTYTVVWKDGSGNVVGNALELLGIPSGVYSMEINYGGNCISTFGPFTVEDIGAPEILNAIPTEEHCVQGHGIITITPAIGNATDYSYSLNGGPFVQNGGIFTGLTAGSYTVMIKDQFGCVGSYQNNPVELTNAAGPQITNIIIIPETSGNSGGSITVYANGTNLSYSLNNGPLQTGNIFSNLSQGYYTLSIEDEFGCLADSVVYVQNLQGNYLIAMAEGDTTCLNAAANSGIRVSHVNGVKDLKATLYYDGSRVRCIYFNDSLPGITGIVYPSLSQIVLEWHGNNAITSNDTITLGELIFETLQPGLADVNWQSAPGTVFTDESGDTIHPDFIPGIIQVHELPQVTLNALPTLCEGDSLNLITTITGGTGPMNLQWNTPQGITTGSNIQIENSLPEHSGKYSFKVSDYFHCIDTTSIDITVIATPKANFPTQSDTIWYESTYQLQATEGYYSYQWSTGDTTYYIQVTKEGEYSVMIQTEEGCENLESVMMMDGIVPIAVPNAFTPNADGLNDTFKPVVNVELVKQFNMSIYNKWGQRIFETTNVGNAWNGKDAQPGVYNWVISYSNRIGKMFQMKGVVTVIR